MQSFVLCVCKWFGLVLQIQNLEAHYSLWSMAVVMTAALNTAASVLEKSNILEWGVLENNSDDDGWVYYIPQ